MNEEFEKHVLDELVYTTAETVDSVEKAMAIANVCYSHDIIRMAAEKVRKRPEFLDDAKLQKLKFRRSWIRGWLRRCAMRKRRITTQVKTLPAPEVVQARMAQIQSKILEGNFTLDDVFSGDETGMLFGAPPLKQYIPFDADRATSPEADDKARFTWMPWGDADGGMGANFGIVRSILVPEARGRRLGLGT